jgi:hypothetical protein
MRNTQGLLVLGPYQLPVIQVLLVGSAIEVCAEVYGPKDPLMSRSYRLYGLDGSLIVDAVDYPEPGIGWDFPLTAPGQLGTNRVVLGLQLRVADGQITAANRAPGAGPVETRSWP